MIGFGYDMIIAVGLIAIVFVALLLVKIGVLPKKSLPFVIGAAAGFFGFTLWRESRMKKLRKELDKREAELLKREEKLKILKDDYQASEEQLQIAKAELEKHRESYKKAIMQLNADNAAEKEGIDQLYGEELSDEFSELLEGL